MWIALRALAVGLIVGQAGVLLRYPTWNSFDSLPYVAMVAAPCWLPAAVCCAVFRLTSVLLLPAAVVLATIEVYLLGFDSATAFALADGIALVSAVAYRRMMVNQNQNR